ncbi:PREDICTED: glucan endo-1,3-beta-glucosidase 8-like [Ipomoea nil]|uniref:glucan endo-1,3-beta-glucosidase 8-like n=1 Tax=Ipomoea nil TaxID=35883 RepID=UPI000901AAF8|nr:PREDICTED: glucan endo-1,3-beta-glucosidase 8-like [Ipomoea nil]
MERRWNWVAVFLLLLLGAYSVDGFIGIQWGRYASQSLVPSVVVDLLLQNGIKEIKLSAPSPNVLEALQSSNIGITVALQNDFIRRDKWLSNIKNVSQWVEELLLEPVQRGVHIQTLIILEEPLSLYRTPVLNMTDVFQETVSNLHRCNLTHIRTTTTHSSDVLKNVSKPSQADFRDDIKDKMLESLRLFKKTNSFFMYNMVPIFSLMVNKWPIEFAFMDNNSTFTIVDGKYTYRNAFEFLFDCLVVTLEKAGYPDMEIVIGEIGWPTDGGKYATPENAERFYRGFLKHISEKKGTPRRPKWNIDVFLSSLTDENKVPLQLGPSYRHRGIYNFDGTPKFAIDFTGKGRLMFPVLAQGSLKMPSRWCVFNGDTSNMTKVEEQFQYACTLSDCSSLSPYSSCSQLDLKSNVSFAFNMFYQTSNQDQKNGGCDFAGLGALTTRDPSMGTCYFPVEILTAEKVDAGIQIPTYIGYDRSGAHALRSFATPQLLFIALSLLYLIWPNN